MSDAFEFGRFLGKQASAADLFALSGVEKQAAFPGAALFSRFLGGGGAPAAAAAAGQALRKPSAVIRPLSSAAAAAKLPTLHPAVQAAYAAAHKLSVPQSAFEHMMSRSQLMPKPPAMRRIASGGLAGTVGDSIRRMPPEKLKQLSAAHQRWFNVAKARAAEGGVPTRWGTNNPFVKDMFWG